nr:FecR domain-containing protein [Bacteroidota bacterium]
TGDKSLASIMFLDATQLKIREKTTFTIRSERLEKRALKTDLKINKGEMWLKVPEGSTFRIETPTSVASVKGTEINIFVDEDGATTLTVIEGAVEFLNEMGTILATEMTTSKTTLGVAPTPPKSIPKKEIPVWQQEVKEEQKLILTLGKPGEKEVGKPFNLQIEVQNIQTGKTVLDYDEDVTVSLSGDGVVFSIDGGQTWIDEAVVKMIKGKGLLKGKGTTFSEKTLTASGSGVSPGKLIIKIKHSKKTMDRIKGKATKVLEKVDPALGEKISGKEMKESRISKGVGTEEDILEKIDSGEYEVISKEIIENPDGSIRVIIRAKPVAVAEKPLRGGGPK